MKEYKYAPKNIAEEKFFDELSGVFNFMKQAYRLYGRMRFRGADFMKDPTPELKGIGEESVAEHLFSSLLLWQLVTPVLPNLSRLIDKESIQQMILIHDIGEVAQGDVSATNQLKGKGKNRKIVEEKAFNSLLKKLPVRSRNALKSEHQRYEIEKANKLTQDTTVLIAKVIDMLQGGHYLLINSINFADHSDHYQQVMDTGFFPYTKRLLTILKEENELEAAQEVRMLIKFYLLQYEKNGAKMVSEGIV